MEGSDLRNDAQRQVSDAFAAFEESLRAALTAEARHAVEAALARMGGGAGPFTISNVEIDVEISSLTLETAAGRPAVKRPAAASQRRKREPATVVRTGARGRPPGKLRTAIEAAFESPETELTVDGLRTHLAEQGVTTSSDNLHQHLRRLVKAGHLQRAGRGTYRAA